MIRHRNLFETYSDDIGNIVDNKLLEEDNPLHPFDIISGELSKINPNIHGIIKTLKSPTLDEIISVHKHLIPAERAVDVLVEKKIDIDSYKRAAAKVVYASDKLDVVIEKEIDYIADRIKSSVKGINEKGIKNSVDNIKKERAKIMNSISDFLKAKDIYFSRGLNPNNILLISSFIDNYRTTRLNSADTQKKISDDLEYYKSLHNISDYKSVLESLISKLKNGLIKGDYVKKSNQNEDYETLIFLKEWQDEIKIIRSDDSIIDMKRDLISKIKETKNYISKVDSLSIEELKKISKNEFFSCNYKIFMGTEIDEYNDLLRDLKDNIKEKQVKEEKRLKMEYLTLQKKKTEVYENEFKKIEFNIKQIKNDSVVYKESADLISNGIKDMKKIIKEDKENVSIYIEKNNEKIESLFEKLNDYDVLIKNINSKLEDIANRFDYLGNKEEKEKVRDAMKQNKDEVNEINRNYFNDLKNYKEKIIYIDFDNTKMSEEMPTSNNTTGKIFSLTSYMNAISYPENIRLYEAKRILSGNNGEKGWSERFENFKEEMNGFSIKEENDYEYLGKIKVGLQKAINKPVPFFDVNAAKESYKLVDEKIKAFAA